MNVSPTDILAILPQLILTAIAMIVLLVDAIKPTISKRTLANITVLGLLAAGGYSAYQWAEAVRRDAAPVLSGMVVADPYAGFFGVVLCLGALISVLLSVDFLERERIAHGEFFALVLFTTLGGMVMAASLHLIVIFIGLEILSIALYILSGYRREAAVSQEAALKYFLLGSFASAFFLYGIALTYGATGTLQVDQLRPQIAALPTSPANNYLLLTGLGLMLVGFAFKVAVVPFHIWTPDVYEGAPTPVTAFMSVVAKAAGFAAFLRVFGTGLPGTVSGEGLLALRHEVSALIASIAALTMIVGNVVAISQSNIKRMLAYSSIAHAGYILIGIMVATRHPLPSGVQDAVSGVLFYTFAYTLSNLGAFGVIMALRRRGEELLSIDDYAGLGFRYPVLGALMTLFMLSMAGIPPTAGFFGKLFIFRSALDVGVPGTAQLGMNWLVVIGVLTSVVSFYFYLRVVTQMYMAQPKGAASETGASSQGHLVAGLALAALGTILLGIIPNPLFQGARDVAEKLAPISSLAQSLFGR